MVVRGGPRDKVPRGVAVQLDHAQPGQPKRQTAADAQHHAFSGAIEQPRTPAGRGSTDHDQCAEQHQRSRQLLPRPERIDHGLGR